MIKNNHSIITKITNLLLTPSVMKVSCISDRRNLDKKTFVTEHRGYNIYLYAGRYNITLYSFDGYNIGSRGYGDGIYVIAWKEDQPKDHMWTSFWVGANYPQKSVDLGVEKAISKMKAEIDHWLAFSEREDNKYRATKNREQTAINKIIEKTKSHHQEIK